MSNQEEQIAFNDFLNGDLTAFSRLYKLHIQGMYRYGFCYCGTKQTVEDAIHDVFIYVYDNRKKLLAVEDFRAYLFTSLRNKLINLSKKSKFEVLHTDFSSLEGEHTSNTIDEILTKEENDQIKRLVQNLSEYLSFREKEIIYLRFTEGLSHRELAAILKIKEQSAKSLLHRAITKMREQSQR